MVLGSGKMIEMIGSELMQTELRSLLQIVIGYIGIMTMLCTLLHRRKHIGVLLAFFLAKSIYSQIITGLLVYMRGDASLLIPVINAIVLPLLDVTIACLFFKDPVYKVLPAIMLSEILGILAVMLCFLVVNVIEGRSDPLTFNGAWMTLDLVLFPLYLVVFGIMYRAVKPLLRRYRDYEPRHPRLLLALVGLYYLSAFVSYVIDYWNTEQVKNYYYINISWVLVLVLLGSLYLRQIRRAAEARRELLHLQQELMLAHYTALRQQEREAGSRMLEMQLETLLSSDASQVKAETITSYLQHLRQLRDHMTAGTYCRDYMIDAVLTCQADRLSRQGMQLSCDLRGFALGHIAEGDLAQLLFELLEDTRQEACGEMRLSMTTICGQLVVSLQVPRHSKHKSKNAVSKAVRDSLKKYEGCLEEVWRGDKYEVTVSLSAAGKRR